MEQLKKAIKYLDGELIGDEKVQFEQDVESNPELKEIIKYITETDNVISKKELVKFIENLKIAKEEFKHSDNKKTAVFRMNNKILIAASILLITGIFTIYNYIIPPTVDNLYKQYYEKYEAFSITRSGENSLNEITIAIQLYDKGKYSEALAKFNNIIKLDYKSSIAHFFAGVSYMELKSFDQAATSLKVVISQKDTAFLEHAQWYLALCYLKLNQTNLAKSLIKQISESDSYYRVQAIDLYKKIN